MAGPMPPPDVSQTADGASYTAPEPGGPGGPPPPPAMVQIQPTGQGGFAIKAFANPQTPPMQQQVGSIDELCQFLAQIFGGADAGAGAPGGAPPPGPPPGPPPPGM